MQLCAYLLVGPELTTRVQSATSCCSVTHRSRMFWSAVYSEVFALTLGSWENQLCELTDNYKVNPHVE